MSFNYQKLLIDPRDSFNEADFIGPTDCQKDLDLLLEALEIAYPAKWVMSSSSWQRLLSDLRSIKIEDNTPVEEFGTQIADILCQIPDAHLKVKYRGSELGGESQKHQRTPMTGANLANISANEFWKIEYKTTGAGSIPVIAIAGFPQSSESHWDGFSEAIQKTLSAPAVIVDLRGNAGGDDARAYELASLYLGRELEMDWVREVFCETAEAIALQINTYELMIWNKYGSRNIVPPVALAKHLEELKEKANRLANAPLSESKVVMRESPQASQSSLAFTKKIFVLIDSATASSGEWAALYLKKHPNTVLVGENTSGMIHFGNTGHLLLPHSGLRVGLCVKINEFTDGRFFEKVGISPDVKIAPGLDGLQAALEMSFQHHDC